jgi:predicted XRE-type DNA-binding protein
MTEQQVLARDAKRNIGAELLLSVRQMKEGKGKVVRSNNVFRDLGFPEAEAQNMLLLGDLVIHIRKVIDKLGITQAEAAKHAGITQPRMNDLIKTAPTNSRWMRW